MYTSTNRHLGRELGRTGVLGVGTGDRDLYMETFYNEQTTTLPFRLGTGGTGVLGVGTGDSGLIDGDVLQ